ncbi:sigma 54-interacting transcriptional regulator [Polyangium sp. 6x1]|uniref:sigma 54-interacting transcriptional regulator n=1 Tax=Polyangium sp. 6x1 TaxID=3042689 RepID=UPI0024824294|nr:sigma 54-interacting transcriptional regulator [Polyangium sp. 6x1]MDI1448503.1 sigma 54-interacting transcriptional regulator [Polyangium sp. 6x1]
MAENSSTLSRHARGAPLAPSVVPALTIASHPLAGRAGERALLTAVAVGREALLSRREPDFVRAGHALGAPLADPFLSRRPIHLSPAASGGVVLVPAGDGTRVAARGAPVYGPVTFGPEEVERGVPIELEDRVTLLLHHAPPEPFGITDMLGMVGQSAGVCGVRQQIERIADLHVPVLIRGETGTGKELVARAVHTRGPRRHKPFVSVNLGALPRETAVADLFGAQRGSYTGATRDREGLFRAAHGGTLFLDEIGEASPEVQVMLLRVLETGELYPMGADRPVAVDVRLLAATDAHLEQHLRDGRFKAPLLHRLAGYEIHVPPLRERREDIGALFHHFAREELSAMGEAHRLSPEDPRAAPWLPTPLAVRLLCHAWPGNIRQLHNITRRLVISSRGEPQLKLDARLAEELDFVPPVVGRLVDVPPQASAPRRKPSEVSEAELVAALAESKWDLKAAADRLGIPRPSIYDLIDRSPSIRTAGDLSAEEITGAHHAYQGDLDAMAQHLKVSKRALTRRLKELKLG